MSTPTPFSGYSPPIRITLEVDGATFDVAETGPEHVALRSPADCGPRVALLIINIDGRERRQKVKLPDGIKKGRDRQPIIALETAALASANK